VLPHINCLGQIQKFVFFKTETKESIMELNIEVIEEATGSIEVLCNSVGCP
jgi:hypothetical protein